MKVKIAVGAVLVMLILAQLIFGGRVAGERGVPKPENASDVRARAQGGAEDGPATPTTVPAPLPEEVTALFFGNADRPSVHLSRKDGGWVVESLRSAPARGERIEAFLHSLLAASREAVAADVGETGLDGDGSIGVVAVADDGRKYPVVVGLRPEGEFASTYVRLPGGETVKVPGDLRGDMGIWKNLPDQEPESGVWLDNRVMRFDPAKAAGLKAAYPDHTISFARTAAGDWEATEYVPGGEWDAEALAAWIGELADFTVSGLAGEGAVVEAGEQRLSPHRIDIVLEDGSEQSVTVALGHDDGEMLLASSERPGFVYILPEWRFDKYFHRLSSLFPKTVPAFSPRDIRFIDIRESGESVKIARRNDAWRGVAVPYATRDDRIDRLAGRLASWRPEDYAAPGYKAVRPAYGGPMVEVTLADGDVHQYRLGGRHPVFPWRYVVLDGREILSVSDLDAGALFPRFADILDLGRVLPGLTPDDLAEVAITGVDDGGELLFARNIDGGWDAADGDAHIALTPDDIRRIIENPLEWNVAGLYEPDRRTAEHGADMQLTMTDVHGARRIVEFLPPRERDIPYVVGGSRAYLLDRAVFYEWLTAIREIAHELRPKTEEPVDEVPGEPAEEPRSDAGEGILPDPEPIGDEEPPENAPDIEAGDVESDLPAAAEATPEPAETPSADSSPAAFPEEPSVTEDPDVEPAEGRIAPPDDASEAGDDGGEGGAELPEALEDESGDAVEALAVPAIADPEETDTSAEIAVGQDETASDDPLAGDDPVQETGAVDEDVASDLLEERAMPEEVPEVPAEPVDDPEDDMVDAEVAEDAVPEDDGSEP